MSTFSFSKVLLGESLVVKTARIFNCRHPLRYLVIPLIKYFPPPLRLTCQIVPWPECSLPHVVRKTSQPSSFCCDYTIKYKLTDKGLTVGFEVKQSSNRFLTISSHSHFLQGPRAKSVKLMSNSWNY